MLDLHSALQYVVRSEGSDLHLKVGSYPIVRVHGRLSPLEQFERLQAEDTEQILREMLSAHPDKQAEFDGAGEIDFSYAVEGLARFRVNAFRQRESTSIVAR